MTEYKASLDKTSRIVSILACLLFAFILFQLFHKAYDSEGKGSEKLAAAGISALLVLIVLLSWLYAPYAYMLDTQQLVVKRRVGRLAVSLEDISQVKLLSDQDMKGTFRVLGVGGLFGYFGIFRVPRIGRVTFYATQSRNRILIQTRKNKRMLITPDDIGLMERIKAHAHGDSD